MSLSLLTTPPTPQDIQDRTSNSSRADYPHPASIQRVAPLARRQTRSSSFSLSSSGVPGLGYYSGRAVKWLGGTSLDVLEELVILRRTSQHLSLLKQWRMHGLDRSFRTDAGIRKEKKIFGIVDDALEMSRTCYSFRINKCAAEIGKELDKWCASAVLLTRETASLLIRVLGCLSPLYLARWSIFDPSLNDIACELMDLLTRVPLALQDATATSAIIRVLAREHASAHKKHPFLGHNLLHIVQATLELRPLTFDELDAIYAMAVRVPRGAVSSYYQPWEMRLFAECSSQDPRFSSAVLGPRGLLRVLDSLRSVFALSEAEAWFPLEGTLCTLQWLSRYAWVDQAVDPDVIALLLSILRRATPDTWIHVRVWAALILRRLMRQQAAILQTLDHGSVALVFGAVVRTSS